jgi:hypothetical protein
MVDRPTPLDIALDGLDEMLKAEVCQHAKNAQLDPSINIEQRFLASRDHWARMHTIVTALFK